MKRTKTFQTMEQLRSSKKTLDGLKLKRFVSTRSSMAKRTSWSSRKI